MPSTNEIPSPSAWRCSASQCAIACPSRSRSHLHPLVAEQHQAVAGAAQRFQLLRRQRAVAQGNLHLEVQHRVGAHPRRRLTADRDRHLRPRPFAPPVRDPDRQAAPLQFRHASQEAIGMLGRPRQRAVEVAGIRQLPHPGARLGRLLHRRQQGDQRRAVVRPCVLLHGVAQRQVLEASAGAETGGESGQKRERARLIVLVLGQMEADPPHPAASVAHGLAATRPGRRRPRRPRGPTRRAVPTGAAGARPTGTRRPPSAGR